MFWACLSFFVGLVIASPLARRQNDIPSFVRDYAPILRIHSQEIYFPSDIAAHIIRTVPEANFQPVSNLSYNLDNLDKLNSLGGSVVYLTSKEGVQALPALFDGVRPDSNGAIAGAKTTVTILIDKPDIDGGVVDVFYMYFYGYNQGNNANLFGLNLGAYGNHVGDWEHNMIRFKGGKPQAVWYSQHAFGQAFTYNAVEKIGLRPVVYVGNGTHANWAKTGLHDHTLQVITLPQNGVLTDFTDAGTMFDPVASSLFYNYDQSSQKFTSYDGSSIAYLNFNGQWGDQQLPNNAPGQMNLFGNARYSSGPNGPKFKDLDRARICLKKIDPCIVSPILLS